MNNALSFNKRLDSNKSHVMVNPVNTINVSVMGSDDGKHVNIESGGVEGQTRDVGDLMVDYPAVGETQIEKLQAENEVLKIIIDMLRHNPIMVNKLILVDDEKLGYLVKLLTNADNVVVDSEDLGCGCGTYQYRKVNAVYVIKGGNTKNLKYDYPEITKELKDVGICTKFVW